MPLDIGSDWLPNLTQRSRRTYSERNRAEVYIPLDQSRKEIRLFVVEPGSGTKPIRGTFRIVSLDDIPSPVYETCSYVWGSASLKGKVYIGGSKAYTPASSEHVLQRMRHADRERVLWIDAVCINQADPKERSQQVAIMAEIYSNTTANLVWLGEQTPYSRSALSSFEAIDHEIHQVTDNLSRLNEMLYDDQNQPRLHTSPLRATYDAFAMTSFLRTAWFTRLWVVQEVAFSRRNVCHAGRLEFDFAMIPRVTSWLCCHWGALHHDLDKESVARVAKMFDQTDRDHGRYASGLYTAGLLSLLVQTRMLLCSDPRDHVFAVLGLHRKSSQPMEAHSFLLAPDYSASVSTVLERATRYSIHEREDLVSLRYVSHKAGDAREQIASWTPRWDCPDDRDADPRPLSFEWPAAHAGVSLDLNMDDISQHTLTVKGFRVDCVGNIGPIWKKRSPYSESATNWFADSNSFVTSVLPDRARRWPITAMTICAGTGRRGARVTEAEAMADCSPILNAFEISPHLRYAHDYTTRCEALGPGGPAWDRLAEFESVVIDASSHRAMFTTSTGYVGLGPKTTQRGDTVTVFYGCQWPVVIRPSGDGDFELVGCCYLHGIMDGEAVRKHRADGKGDEVFHLK